MSSKLDLSAAYLRSIENILSAVHADGLSVSDLHAIAWKLRKAAGVVEAEIESREPRQLFGAHGQGRRHGNSARGRYKRIDPPRRSHEDPASRAAATAPGAAQLRQLEQPQQSEPEQFPQLIKRRHGGTPPLLSPEEIAASKEYCNQQLDADSDWIVTIGGKQKACVDIIVNKIPRLRDRAQKCWQTIKRQILDPVLEDRQKSDDQMTI
jgi:hypothetical protein